MQDARREEAEHGRGLRVAVMLQEERERAVAVAAIEQAGHEALPVTSLAGDAVGAAAAVVIDAAGLAAAGSRLTTAPEGAPALLVVADEPTCWPSAEWPTALLVPRPLQPWLFSQTLALALEARLAAAGRAENQRLREEAERQRDLLQKVFDHTPVGLALTEGPEHRHLLVNPAQRTIAGGREPLVGRTVAEVYPEAAGSQAQQLLDQAYQSGEPRRVRDLAVPLMRDGELREAFFTIHYVPLRDREQVHGLLVVCHETTSEVVARRAAERSEARLTLALSAAGAGTFEHDLRRGAIVSSDETNALYGFAPGEFGGRYRDWFKRVHPEDREPLATALESVSSEGQFAVEFRIQRHDTGELRWIRAIGKIHCDDDGTPRRVLGINLDITDQKRFEEEVRSAALFPEENPGPILRIGRDGTLLYANPASEALLAEWSARRGEKVPGEVHEAVLEALVGGRRRELELNLGQQWLSFLVVPLPERGYANLYGRDTSARRAAQTELIRQREWLRVTLTSIGEAVIACDTAGRVTFLNAVAAALCGWGEAEALDRPILEVFRIVDEQTGEPADDLIGRVLREGCTAQLANHTALVTRDGRTVPIEDSAAPIRDAAGEVAGVVLVFQDVTARRAAEQRQATLTDGLRAVLAAADDLLACTTLEELLRRAVELCRDRLGLEQCGLFLLEGIPVRLQGTFGTTRAGEVVDQRERVIELGERWRELFGPAPASGPRWMLRRQVPLTYFGETVGIGDHATTLVQAGQVVLGVLFNDNAASGRPLDESRQEAVAVFGSLLGNIIQRRRAEEQLAQAAKMEAVGKLAGGVAHDFNNLLTAILGYTDFLLSDPSLPGEVAADMRQVHGAAQQAAGLTQQLLAFSRKQMLRQVLVDLAEVVRGLSIMLRRILGEDIELVIEPLPERAPVRGDVGQIQQVIMNLAVNARDAMPTGGRLSIALVRVAAGRAPAHLSRQTDYLRLTVTDTGCGMDEETRRRVFEPFFTTKELGQGTGLGLATCYGIVCQSGGEMAVESAPGRGSTFIIWLPAAAEEAEPLEPAPAAEVAGGAETILLVEDEPSVRMLAVRALEQRGYQVLVAGSAREAMGLAAAEARIDLLVTDVVMPETGGGVLAAQLRAERPELPVLFISGYADDVVVRHGVAEAQQEFLQKPFTTARLADKVRQILDRQ